MSYPFLVKVNYDFKKDDYELVCPICQKNNRLEKNEVTAKIILLDCNHEFTIKSYTYFSIIDIVMEMVFNEYA